MARDRSRSPGRKPRNTRGFGFKKQDPTADAGDRHRSDYRERDEAPRRKYRDDDEPSRRRHDDDPPRRRRDDDENEPPKRKHQSDATDRPSKKTSEPIPKETPEASAAAAPAQPVLVNGVDIAAKFGAAAAARVKANPPKTSASSVAVPDSSSVETSEGSSRRPTATGPMILVTVNDRLGTKAQVPCLASDTIGDFKKIVAMKIGRRPHEILVKRQSERPFKDMLTLEDYGVSNGVQLDLELDTGE